MNEPTTGTGDRYCVIFFNKGHGDKNLVVEMKYLPVQQGAEVDEALRVVLWLLSRTKFPVDRSNQTTGDPHSKYGKRETHAEQWKQQPPYAIPLGLAPKGKPGALNANCTSQKYRMLYTALCEYFGLLCPGLFSTSDPTATYNTLIITKNAQCVWHTDGRNSGPATLMALGDFEGGGRFLIQPVASSSSAGMCVCVCMCLCPRTQLNISLSVCVCIRAGDTGV